MRRPARAHILALLATFLAIVAVSALWIVNLRLGPPLEGLSGGPMVVFVPFVMLIFVGVWLVIRGLLHGRVKWRLTTVVLTTLVASVVVVVFTCGPISCFTPGANRLLGWFVVGGVTIAALVHHLILNSFTPVSKNG